MDSFPLCKYWKVGLSCSSSYRLWVWCWLIYLSPVLRMRRESFYLLIWGSTLPAILSLSFISPFLFHLWAPPLLFQFQYLWNHKNSSAISHFIKAILILSRRLMCRTSDNDGCYSTCKARTQRVLAEQNHPINYFVHISNRNTSFSLCTNRWQLRGRGSGEQNEIWVSSFANQTSLTENVTVL